MQLNAENPVISLEVEVKGYEILSAYPLLALPSSSQPSSSTPDTKVAVLGLLGKMTGAAAVVGSETRREENGRVRVEVALKALGSLGVYVSSLGGGKSVVDDVLVLVQGRVVPVHTVRIQEQAPVLEVDVERAWDEMGLEAGWSNELKVELFV